MSELQEITTTDLEEKISPDNDSIILSEKDDDSDFEDDSISMPGDENIIRIPPRPKNYKIVYHLYIVFAKKRDQLLKYCLSKGIEAKVHYPKPIYIQEFFKDVK